MEFEEVIPFAKFVVKVSISSLLASPLSSLIKFPPIVEVEYLYAPILRCMISYVSKQHAINPVSGGFHLRRAWKSQIYATLPL